jgi:hypothetical protein
MNGKHDSFSRPVLILKKLAREILAGDNPIQARVTGNSATF